MSRRFRKRAVDELVLAVDFSERLNPGETIVPSNARGTLGVTVADSTGTDVSTAMIDGAPNIVAGSRVTFLARGGSTGPLYQVTVVAPTSDNEILSERAPLEIRP